MRAPPRRRPRPAPATWPALCGAWLVLAALAGNAHAEAPEVDVTQTAVGAYHGDNRDSLTDNDDYAEWTDRLGLQLRWRGITAALRLDSAVYFTPPSPAYLASQDVAPSRSAAECPGEALQTCYDRKLLEYERALLNRYRNTVYPSKVSVTTTRPGWELTLGDFYAQFGRGLVLSIRKVDEFAYDTTVRGAKLDANWQGARARVDGTVLAGLANPVRVDEISGRRLTAPGSWLFPAMPTYDAGAAFAPAASETFRPDGILGARVAAGTDRFMVGAQASMIARGGLQQLAADDDVAAVAFRTGAHPARQVKYLETASLSLSLPRLGDNAAAYVEGAVQGFDPASSPFGDSAGNSHAFTGYAVTGSLSWARDALSTLLEVRHTRRFSPLMANVDVGRANEFFGLQYSAPPTTEPITTDTEFGLFGYCSSGGRGRADVRLGEHLIIYQSLGAYRTWSERSGDCDATGGGLLTADRNDVLDPYAGVILTYDRKRSRAHVWGGARFDQTAVAAPSLAGPLTNRFYRERYVRYDALHTIDETWAVQVQGTHRHREEPATDRDAWNEGENYLAVHWAARVIASFGYEYTTRYDRTLNYFNGAVFVRLPRRWFPQDSNLRVFVGQQRGALRCINGVCKVFPDFTGARAELVLRF